MPPKYLEQRALPFCESAICTSKRSTRCSNERSLRWAKFAALIVFTSEVGLQSQMLCLANPLLVTGCFLLVWRGPIEDLESPGHAVGMVQQYMAIYESYVHMG